MMVMVYGRIELIDIYEMKALLYVQETQLNKYH